MSKTFDVPQGEAARIEAAIDECLAAIKSNQDQMARDRTDIERLRSSTREKLAAIEHNLVRLAYGRGASKMVSKSDLKLY